MGKKINLSKKEGHRKWNQKLVFQFIKSINKLDVNINEIFHFMYFHLKIGKDPSMKLKTLFDLLKNIIKNLKLRQKL